MVFFLCKQSGNITCEVCNCFSKVNLERCLTVFATADVCQQQQQQLGETRTFCGPALVNLSCISGCPAGQWGPQCTRLCNCETPDTTCNPTTGCVTCPRGFEGGDCSTDIDECLMHPCDAHSTCVNTPGNFRCDCEEGYTQSNATTCKGRSVRTVRASSLITDILS